MRKKDAVACAFVVLCVWVLMTSFLLLFHPLTSSKDLKKDAELEERLSKLESSLIEEAHVHDSLLSHIRTLINKNGIKGNENSLLDQVKSVVLKPGEDGDNAGVAEADSPDPPEPGVETDYLGADGDQVEQVDEGPVKGPTIAILVFSCNRVTVSRCIDGLLRYRPSKQQFPIIVSQDCMDTATANVIRSYGDKISFIQQPDQSDIPIPPKEKKFKGYFRIARHYGWALNHTFFTFNYNSVIIVEDDLEVAPDFYEYFLGTHELLKKDPSLWCVSAWNDNGKEALVDTTHPEQLYRTDFFPGLGWMLTRELWAELAVKWPKSYWDDWIRDPGQRKGRACIRPEVSRTRTFGKVGVSNGLFYEKHLKYIKLNDMPIRFTSMDLGYLHKDVYDVEFVKKVYDSPIISYEELKTGKIPFYGDVRIPYHTKDNYKRTAKMLGLMDDFRSGVPRTAYRGIVTFMYNKRRVYLAPSANWKGYNIKWS
ncbi:alpha-1,3-mannosyl-glycoprotein 2-beta-N-acetylglucosaminyltransferase-like isoform X2 [Thrips palmi]|uniref:Alpha-1,3-mannosyl-glycoprotein 2-beta-N-acetylglucosaminyltransferase n=1 Tax=Thrips palmi TaxID=161013 RepID=A0A6P8XU00_THRPL|nr:alpha-1,3-mannosyl-glycoprotein 2-beta-N-acetylglucosaminyltransferase-like isoform X2 [Thrips palmi]